MLKKIVVVDETKMNLAALEKLKNYAEEVEVSHDYPDSEEEIVDRIKDAEAVIVSWRTEITSEIINQAPNLKYIGMACSLFDEESANVAVKHANEKGIKVTGIFDYGDPGVIEYIISSLINLLHGFGNHQWKKMPVELSGRKVGIIGLGTTGKLLANALLTLGADVYYFSKTRKPAWEEKGVKYLALHALLEKSEIISLHLPKNTTVLKEDEFKKLGFGKILVNTSLGLPFEEDAFKNWIQEKENYALFDGDAKNSLSEEIQQLKNIVIQEKSAGWSQETQMRLSKKVLDNIENYLEK
ncbi:NAD(P)-dependent oxidoreductase [Mesonia aquimarina]|uniref:NAD(P)-dependent oxidoreductase n=1 Tax=Mesonia aquimarina TaxID=1504967 RepID=UPI000EF5FE32|nr:NAD(P)-dependent oxidoreductase [Mesonia aquimarina]